MALESWLVAARKGQFENFSPTDSNRYIEYERAAIGLQNRAPKNALSHGASPLEQEVKSQAIATPSSGRKRLLSNKKTVGFSLSIGTTEFVKSPPFNHARARMT